MKRIFITLFIVLTAVMALSCAGKVEEDTEPEYELIIPPMTEEFDVDAANADVVPVDLAPCEDAIATDPENPDLRFAYMVELRTAGMTVEAMEQAKILVEMEGENPYSSIAYLNYAEMVLDELPSDAPGRSEMMEEAMAGMWVALGWEPESVPAHLTLGRLALEAGDKEKALHHLSITLTAIEIGYELRIRMAEIYIVQGEIENAREHLEVARHLAEDAENNDAVRVIDGMLDGIE